MKKRILCFGDSNTWGFTPITGERYPEGVRWTSLLGEYTGAQIIEEGLNGRTSIFNDPLLPYAKGIDYIEACAVSQSPFDLLIVMLGTNDMKTYVANCADAAAKGAAMICNKAKQLVPDIKVLLVSPIVIGKWRPELGEMLQLDEKSIENTYNFSRFYEEQARLNGFYFLDASKYAVPSQEDAVHMMPEEHKKLARAMADKVNEIFS